MMDQADDAAAVKVSVTAPYTALQSIAKSFVVLSYVQVLLYMLTGIAPGIGPILTSTSTLTSISKPYATSISICLQSVVFSVQCCRFKFYWSTSVVQC
jgi:hypothetical protein